MCRQSCLDCCFAPCCAPVCSSIASLNTPLSLPAEQARLGYELPDLLDPNLPEAYKDLLPDVMLVRFILQLA